MGELPLSGVRVVELGGIGPAPFAGLLLAEMGADVLRIERPAHPGAVPGQDPLNRGKTLIQLDLRTVEGVEPTLSATDEAHIVIEGFRPGVAERLGVGPEVCRARNPALVYGRITGWGQSGPLATTAGHDINYIGITGALHAIGRLGQPPSVPLFLVGDLGGGSMFLLAGILAALHRARETGRGDVVDAAIVDGVSKLMTTAYGSYAEGDWVDERGTNLLDSGRPWYDVYETSDGKWMSVGAIEDKFYAELIRTLAIAPHDAQRDDPAGWAALRDRIAACFRGRTRAEWEAVFATVDACVAPVLSLAEAPANAHLQARATFTDDGGPARPKGAPRFESADLATTTRGR
jgi:alpha-methylacyl-CoA racemase